MKMKLVLFSIICVFGLITAPAFAKVVRVLDTTTGGGIGTSAQVNNFYNLQPGVTSALVSGNLTATDLVGADLLVINNPDNDFLASEISAMADFLSGAKRILFLGENAYFTPQNDRITGAISTLGGSMTIDNVTIDSGYHIATVGNGQILSHPLNTGVNSLEYAAPSGISGVVGGEALFLGIDLATVWAGHEMAGGGSIVLVSDSNIIRDLAIGSYDNDVFFNNMLSAVPEPATMILLGLGGLATMRKHRM